MYLILDVNYQSILIKLSLACNCTLQKTFKTFFQTYILITIILSLIIKLLQLKQ